jgi:hypothetical protein
MSVNVLIQCTRILLILLNSSLVSLRSLYALVSSFQRNPWACSVELKLFWILNTQRSIHVGQNCSTARSHEYWPKGACFKVRIVQEKNCIHIQLDSLGQHSFCLNIRH